jgi:protease-4
MIRRLLIGLLATLGGFVLVLMLGLAAGAWLFWPGQPGLPGRMVLALDLRAALDEVPPPAPLAALEAPRAPTLADTVLALDQASRDPRVAGLIAQFSGDGPGLAQSQELRAAIARLRDQGKFAIAHADSFGEFGPGTVSYYLASAFEEIHLQPHGALGLTGIVLESPLLRGLLDKLGVEPSGDKRGPYKTAADMFIEREITPQHRESLDWLADSLDEQIRSGLAEGRGLDRAAVDRAIDGGPYVAPEARALGLIDGESYWDEVVERAVARAGDGAEMVELARYVDGLPPPAADAPVVALIRGVGQIARGDSSNGPTGWIMGGDTIAKAFSDAIGDPEVKAILFRIDSGGGSAVASETIGRQVRRAVERGKPVIVSMAEVAASGGYWIAMDAARIVADPGTLTGSIGVLAGKPVLDGLWADLGIAWGRVERGANAAMWSPNVDYSARGRERLEAFLDYTYWAFTEGVARGRDLPPEQVEEIAQGRVWTGAQAKERGLVDELGGFARALEVAKEAAELAPEQPVQLRPFPPDRSPLEQAIDLLAGGGPFGIGVLAQAWQTLTAPGLLSAPSITIR